MSTLNAFTLLMPILLEISQGNLLLDGFSFYTQRVMPAIVVIVALFHYWWNFSKTNASGIFALWRDLVKVINCERFTDVFQFDYS